MKQISQRSPNSKMNPSPKLLKLKYLLQNAKISDKKFLLKDSEKLKNLSISTFYSSFVERPLNLLFSVDQFLFEFSKKTYQQKKTGEFFQQLKERKKLSLFYGYLSKKQLTSLFNTVKKNKGYFSKNVFSLLERRLDVVIYRSGLTKTIAQARQLIKHNKILVNYSQVNIPSYLLYPGDIISVTPELFLDLSNQLVTKLKTEQLKNHPQIFGDFYSKLKKILENSVDLKQKIRQNFRSQVLCNLMIQLVCTKIKLRSFYCLKKNLLDVSNTVKTRENFSTLNSGTSTNHQEKTLLILFKIKKGFVNHTKKTLSLKKNYKMRNKSADFSKRTQQKSVLGHPEFLEKKPVFWNRSFINFKQRKSLSLKSQKNQKDSKNLKGVNLKKKNLALFRNNFLVFLKYLENSNKFASLLSLNMKKYLFKRSFFKKKSMFWKVMNFRLMKPMHLEISYNLLKIIYLYSPQRLNFPFYIDLDLIKRSLR